MSWVGQVVGVEFLEFGWPTPRSALVGFAQGHHVVGAEVGGVGSGRISDGDCSISRVDYYRWANLMTAPTMPAVHALDSFRVITCFVRFR